MQLLDVRVKLRAGSQIWFSSGTSILVTLCFNKKWSILKKKKNYTRNGWKGVEYNF